MAKYKNANIHYIKNYVKGKTFADIGCMWAVFGGYSFLAEESGAAKVIGVDIYPEQPEFIENKKKKNSKMEFIQGDINSDDTIAKIGAVDIVFCSGVLYHVPDPVFTLQQLYKICNDDGMLILNSMSIPEQKLKSACVLFPELPEKQLKEVAMERKGFGLSEPYDSEQGYANWVWGMSPSCIRGMLKLVGFEVVDEDIAHNGYGCAFLCRKKTPNFNFSSGVFCVNDERTPFEKSSSTTPSTESLSSKTFLKKVAKRILHKIGSTS